MSSPGSTTPDPAPWPRLFSLAGKEADDRQLLERELRRWCDAHGGAEAALYNADNGACQLQVKVGAAPFPARLQADDPAPAAAWSRVELPAAVFLHTAGEEVVPDDPELLLLAAGARICELKRLIHQQSFEAKFRGVELEALYDVGLAIASTLDLEKLCEEVLLRAIALLDARCGALYFLENGSYRLNRTIGGEARDEIPVDEAGVDCLLAGDCPTAWIPGASHLLAVPIGIEGSRRGFLVVADKENRYGVGPFPTTDRRTLALFANQAAIAFENARLHRLALEKERLEREMELAAEIQKQILPKVMPEIPGFEVIGWNRPALQIGGDYFDLPSLANGDWGLVVGDVTGKGMPAALLVSTLHSALRLLLDRMEVGPELITRLNRHIYESSSPNKFITMLLAAVNCTTHQLVYLNAGHNPGLLVRSDGEVLQLSSAGLPLGLLPESNFAAATVDLGPGDLVCLYSDGITESESPAEEEFGVERLIELLRRHRRAPLGEIVTALDRTTSEFAQGQPQGDDQTVVLLRRS